MVKVFLSFYKMKLIEQCFYKFKPVLYRRYADDTFVLIESAKHLSIFDGYPNTCDPNMSYLFEQEINGWLLFLDVEVYRQQGTFVKTVYRTPTFNGVYTNFDSLVPPVYKVGMVYILAYRCFKIYSDQTRFRKELNFWNMCF